jgi:hypothetical protein
MPLWVTRCLFTAIRTRGFMPSAAMFGAGTPMAGTVTGIGKSGIMAEGMVGAMIKMTIDGMAATVATADKRQFSLQWPTFASRGSLPQRQYLASFASRGSLPQRQYLASFASRGFLQTSQVTVLKTHQSLSVGGCPCGRIPELGLSECSLTQPSANIREQGLAPTTPILGIFREQGLSPNKPIPTLKDPSIFPRGRLPLRPNPRIGTF